LHTQDRIQRLPVRTLARIPPIEGALATILHAAQLMQQPAPVPAPVRVAQETASIAGNVSSGTARRRER